MARELGWATYLGCFLWASSVAAQQPPAASFPNDDKPAPTAAPAVAPTAGAPPVAPAAPTATSAELNPAPPPPSAEPGPQPPLDSTSVQPPLAQEEDRKAQGPYVSVTFSPLHLISPIFELQVEGRVVPHFGIALIGGIGSIKSEPTVSGLDEHKFSALELGGQLIGYPLQPFESLQLGAELMYIHIATETFQGQEIKANAGGLALGPLVGYKLLTKIGFTFFVQGGFQYVAVTDAPDDTGASASAKRSAFVPLLNLNIGWSF